MCNFDQEIFQSSFDLPGAHLVEASAGTGKTYNIQNIYARLVMETDFRVSEILVMTFTDAATKELRERLHTVLKDVYARLCGGEICVEGEDKEQCRKTAAERARRADCLIACSPAADGKIKKDRVELALLEFDCAAISTIHGFCQRVLKRYAFETGVDFARELVNNKEAELNAAAEDWWRKHPDHDIKLSDLKKYIRKLGEKADYRIDSDDETLAVAAEIVNCYEQERLERENLNFDDLLRILRDTLKNEKTGQAFAGKLRKEYKAALVDEFQDTDPVQYDIFKSVFQDGEHPCPLYFVGDPKQAIYEFRGGDIYTYFKASEGLKKHSLNVNHRSTRRLMDAVNAMFHEEKEGVSFGTDRIAYTDSGVPEDADEGEERPLRIVRFDCGGESPSRGKNMPAIIRAVAGQILDILSERDETGKRRFSPGDIAILLGSKTYMPILQKELFKAGVPSVVRNPGNVFASSAAVELVTYLTAVAEGGSTRRKNIRAALLTVFGGVKTEDADAELNDPNRFAVHVAHLKSMRSVWISGGFSALASRMEQNGYLLRLAGRPDGERLLADVGQIMELCCGAGKVGVLPENLIRFLNEQIKKADDEEKDAEEFQRELETDGEAVKIMTIHASKGLQFPVVFLPDCWSVNSSRDPRNQVKLPCYHDDQGQLVFSGPGDRAAGDRTKKELELERIRWLYVALTRAKRRMTVYAPAMAAEDSNEPLLTLLENLRKQKKGDPNPPYDEMLLPADAGGACSGFRPELPPLSETVFDLPVYSALPVKGSYSSLSPVRESDADDVRDCDRDTPLFFDPPPETPEKVFSIPGGEKLGTCWHNILEKVPFDADEKTIRELCETELLEGGFPLSGSLDITVEMVWKTLNHPLRSPDGKGFTLRDIPWEDRLSEQEFNFCSVRSQKNTGALGGILLRHWQGDASKGEFIRAMKEWSREIPKGFMTGIIDLVFRHEGIYYIIDWKSNVLERNIDNFDEEGIRTEMARHGYFFQYMLYCAVLHCYLKSELKQDYSWEKCFGGVRYYFLRGIAAGGRQPVFADRPSEQLLDEFCTALGMEVAP